MVKQKLNNNRGFTFIELVIAVAILTIIMGSVVQFMATTSVAYQRTNRDNEVQRQAQDVYDTISTCIMQANKVVLYGKAGTASSPQFYITDNQPKVATYDPSEGWLGNAEGKKLKFDIPYANTTGTLTSPNKTTAKFLGFLAEKPGSGSTNTYTEVKVTALYFEYQTKITGTYETCYATFYYDSTDGNLYLNRHYDSDSDIDTYKGVIDMTVKKSSILCKTLKTDGFRVTVDADANSIGLVMDFENYNMSYKTLGMTKIRNSHVLAR